MGFLDSVLGKEETAPIKPGLPFAMTCSLRPVRLAARRESSLELLVNIKNVSKKPVMASVSVEIPKALGFENLGITRIKEVRMAEMPPGIEKTVSFSVCSSSQTPAGTYMAIVTLNEHYRDYEHILNYVKKNVEIRVV